MSAEKKLTQQELESLRSTGGAFLKSGITSLDEITEPRVLEFMAALEGRNFIDFDELQQKSFMKFWPYIAIHRFEGGDFKYIFDGTHLVNNFGCERTGLMISELPNQRRRTELFDLLQDILANKRPMFSKGDLNIDDRAYKKWQQVKMPLQRKGEINEVLTLLVFESQPE
jgi:hypothetical protein